jgi:hypothetical protein
VCLRGFDGDVMGLRARAIAMKTTTTLSALRSAVRISFVALTVALVMLIGRGITRRAVVHATASTIADENRTQPGAIGWDITAAGDPDIQGFATDISANVGDMVRFKIAAPDAIAGYSIDVYRLGYYGGAGATLVATVAPSATMPQAQPGCLSELATTGLVDCGNWTESASWAVPPTPCRAFTSRS